jgi:hypothetical protein
MQMNKSSSLACAKKLSEHEAVLAKLQSIVRESQLTIVVLTKRVFFGTSFLVTFLRKKSNKIKIKQSETPNSNNYY